MALDVQRAGGRHLDDVAPPESFRAVELDVAAPPSQPRPGGERQVLQDAATEAGRYQRELSREQAASAIEQLKKAGMQVTELPAAEQAKLREKMKPVIDKHTATVGEATVRDLMAELARLRK